MFLEHPFCVLHVSWAFRRRISRAPSLCTCCLAPCLAVLVGLLEPGHISSSAIARLRLQKTSGWLLPVRSLRYAWICLFKDDMGEMTGCSLSCRFRLRISPFRSFLDVSCVARRVMVGFTRRKTSGSAISGAVAGAAMPVFLAPAKHRSRCHLALCTICMEARTLVAPVIGVLFFRQDMPTSIHCWARRSWQRTQTQAAQPRTAYSVGRTHNN